ncbi:hypothetical protein CVS40_2243 [Lucilia cuprina]|nr:hypothetical protein CVS40_2243 [Lucilia cuprina]
MCDVGLIFFYILVSLIFAHIYFIQSNFRFVVISCVVFNFRFFVCVYLRTRVRSNLMCFFV